jgi:hypothetical protein
MFHMRSGIKMRHGVLLGLCMLIVGVALTAGAQHYCQSAQIGGHVIIDNSKAVNPGYMLVTPYYIDPNLDGTSGEADLINEQGIIVHSWRLSAPVLYAVLRDNGNIVVELSPPGGPTGTMKVPGSTGIIEELDWSGKVLWHYEDPEMFGIFTLLPDGGLAYLKWDKAPAGFSNNVVGGTGPTNQDVMTQAIVVLDDNRKVKSVWHMYEHLNPKEYPISQFVPRLDWSHTNSIDYAADNPISHTPAFLLSLRHSSTVILVDAKTGAVVWKSPAGKFSLQHDASMLENGDIMLFDNGLFRQGVTLLKSAVVEFDPRTDRAVWNFNGGAGLPGQVQFASSIMGGAQRLPNGNTFISVTATSHFYEVTKDGKVVWEYVNDFKNDDGQPSLIFMAHKYDSAGTWWGSKVVRPSLASLACLL